MDNLKTIISSYNKKFSNSTVKPTSKYICRNKNNCPLEGLCLTDKIVYKAEVNIESVVPEQPTNVYFRIADRQGIIITQNCSETVIIKQILNYQNTYGN